MVEPWTVGAHRFRTRDNVAWWNGHDWSSYGEEWTPSAAWKTAVVERFLRPYLTGGAVLEIGPGGGRWTAVIQTLARQVYVLDVARRPLEVCRERFKANTNIQYILGDGCSIPLGNASVDGIWSYDVFVHISPVDARSYVRDFARVLRPGAYAVIHHPGSASTTERVREHRSDLTDQLVRDFAIKAGLDVVAQTTELVNVGDGLTVLRRRSDPVAASR